MEEFPEEVPAWWWPEYQSGTLTSVERLMVALYERALKDLTQCVASKGRDKWSRAYDALYWFLDDDERVDEGYPFRYVCEMLDWDPALVRARSRRLFLHLRMETRFKKRKKKNGEPG